MQYEPYFYQDFAEQFVLDNAEAGLLLDMGMGKTVITLSAAEKLLEGINKVLIIAPLKPAVETWPTELKKWDHLKNLTWSMIIGTEKKRLAALERDTDFYIINRENVPWLVRLYKKAWPFDMVIIDELSSFKSSKSQRFRELRKVRPYIKRIVGLTGTPTPNGLLDLWPQMYLLDEGKALGGKITGYRGRYFLPDKRNANVIFSWKPKDGAEEEIYSRLSGLCISMKSADYLKLPERIFIRHEVEMSAEATKLYKQLERDTLLPFADGDIDAPTAAILVNKLLQAAGGAAYDENGGVVELHNEKLEALDTLIEEANGQPVLIYYAYKHERDRILRRWPEAMDIKTAGSVEAWNSGEIPVLLAHPMSAGHGLNMQFGGHIIIWYGLPCSLELYQQANKRLHRPGQTEPVLIHHLLMAGTRDAWVLDNVLAPKDIRQNALLDALRAVVKEVAA